MTGGVEQPAWVVLHSFEPGVASFGLDGAVTAAGLQLFGADFIGKTRDAAQRQMLLLKVLRERRLLLIWDNFESVRSLPDPSGATPPLDAAEQARIRAFLAELARPGGQSGVIITSRTPEAWLGEVRRLALGGLTPGEAAEMAEDVLKPYPQGRARRGERAFAELLEWLDGHPLSLRVLLPQLETTPPASLLAALQGNTAQLPAGFVGEGRLASLGASLKYSLDHLGPELRDRLPALALFEGVVDEDVLGLLAGQEGVPGRFAGVGKEDWAALLGRLAGIGLLTALGGGMYGLHPALPAYLMAEWRRLAGTGFAAEHMAAEQALLQAYAGFGDWLQPTDRGRRGRVRLRAARAAAAQPGPAARPGPGREAAWRGAAPAAAAGRVLGRARAPGGGARLGGSHPGRHRGAGRHPTRPRERGRRALAVCGRQRGQPGPTGGRPRRGLRHL